jgi:hypothetical protein
MVLMARSLTVKHEESPSALFAMLLLLCGGLLLLAATVGAWAEPSTQQPAPVETPAR